MNCSRLAMRCRFKLGTMGCCYAQSDYVSNGVTFILDEESMTYGLAALAISVFQFIISIHSGWLICQC